MRRGIFAGLALVLSVLLLSCATDPSARKGSIGSGYRSELGPLPYDSLARFTLPFPALQKDLMMRLTWPTRGGPHPVIILSHGNGCSQDYYVGLAEHWASWGYVVMQPIHVDSSDLGFTMKGKTLAQMNQVVASRRQDVRFILDSMSEFEDLFPELNGRIDSERVAAAGHSMGAGTMMVLNGVQLESPRDGSLMRSSEDRFKAVLLISEPGNNRLMPDEPWRMTRPPTMISTGSNDFSSTGARDGKKSSSAWTIPENAVFPLKDTYYLDINGADHYLGGAICKPDVPGPPDNEALAILNGVSVAFFDAYVKNSGRSARFMQRGNIGVLTDGRATLEPK